MTWKTRLMVREGTLTALAFTAAAYSYYLFAFWGVQDHFVDGPLRRYMASGAVHVELIMSGLLFGGLIGVINRLTETPRLRSRSALQLVLVRTVLYLVGLGVVAGMVMGVFVTLILPWDVLSEAYRAMTPRYSISFAIWALLAVGMINFALEVERVVGPGNLWRLLVGRYRRPREEERVFLFMDLRGSTHTAEALGHRRYSEFIQACYRDLTAVVMRYEATIYQYVGDEVVLSWPTTTDGSTERDSVEAFFAYRSALAQKGRAYEDDFGVAPVFRGGIDVGPVTVSEVGEVKRDIVYHGDVLNTAARLLELCKARGEELVVSHPVGAAVEHAAGVSTRWQEQVSLRGKQGSVLACGLKRTGDAG